MLHNGIFRQDFEEVWLSESLKNIFHMRIYSDLLLLYYTYFLLSNYFILLEKIKYINRCFKTRFKETFLYQGCFYVVNSGFSSIAFLALPLSQC